MTAVTNLVPRYFMIALFPALYVFWKFTKKTTFYKPADVDLHKNLDEIAEYEAHYVPEPPK